MTVLVLTAPGDITADLVVDQLGRLGVPVLRVDPADFPRRVTLTVSYASGVLTGQVAAGRHRADLAELTGIWVRRPGRPGRGAAVQPAWVAHECDHAWYGALAASGARWMNPLDATAAARYKLPQLVAARAAGLAVPDTVVTNEPAVAERFAGRAGPVVCKSVSGRPPGNPPMILPTTVVPAGADFAPVAETPTCLQQRIDKRCDVRLTVVGQEMFAARVVTPSAALDWRHEDPARARWTAVEVPPAVGAAVGRFMRLGGLAYGALDFAVTREDEWLFLECNASGQFGFVEAATEMPISRAIARWLASPEKE